MKKALPYLLLIGVLVIALLFKRGCHIGSSTNTTGDDSSFDRHPVELFFSKHAKCRMRCRQITQEEVWEILSDGKINYDKTKNDSQGATYALEGYSHEKQHIRAVFAPHKQHMTVVTVIDLDNEWPCPSCD